MGRHAKGRRASNAYALDAEVRRRKELSAIHVLKAQAAMTDAPSNPSLAPVDLAEVQTLLPASVKALVAVLGLHDACDLVRAVGGTTLLIPVCRTDAGDACFEYLAERVGRRTAQALVDGFGGEVLYIARCDAALTEIAYRRIRRDFDLATGNGHSSVQAVAALAGRYGYSDRHIWSILKMTDRTVAALSGAPADPRQARLCE